CPVRRAPGALDHARQPLRRAGTRIPRDDVVPHPEEVRRPPGTDDTGADDGDCLDSLGRAVAGLAHQPTWSMPLSPRISRASAGAAMSSDNSPRMRTILATCSALDSASRPFLMNRPSSSPTRTCEPMQAEAVIILN